MHKTPEMVRPSPSDSGKLPESRGDPPVVARTFQHVTRKLSRIIEAGQADRTIRPGDPLLVALSVVNEPVHFSLLRGVGQALPGLDRSDPSTLDRVMNHATEFVRRGLT